MAEIIYDVTPAMVAEFRDFYEEFADATKWTGAQITKALYIARGEFGTCASWGIYGPYTFLQRGWFALAAHYLIWNRARTTATQADGSASTPYAVSSKTVRDESVTYVVPGSYGNGESGLAPWDQAFALTPYGLEFLRLRDRAGMGAICV